MREPLRHRSFRLLFAAQCASFLGDAIFIVAIAFAVLQVTGSGAALGTVLAAGGAAMVVTFAVSGVWADRIPRVRIMVTSDIVRLASQSTLAALLLTDTARMWHLLVLNVVYSIATAFFMPARTALMPQLLTADHLVTANGLMGTAENLMWTTGWAAGGFLVAAIGPGWAIAIDATTFGASALLLLVMGGVPLPDRATDVGGGSFVSELRDGWREVRSRRWIWFTLATATGFLLMYEGPLQVVGPIVTKADYAGARSWGLMLAGAGAGAALGAVVAASGLLRRPMLVSMWLFLGVALVPALLLVQAPVAAVMAAMAIAGMSFGLFTPVWESALQGGVPSDKLARVSAWDWMCSLSGMPIGMALAGWLTEGVGREAVLAGMSIGTFLVCLAFLLEPSVRMIDAPGGPAGIGVSTRISAGSKD
ncbi:MAG: MFS transporter [Thermoleophilia bacterium]|nr:MFS transporter [Thermoleophilia bacterium]